MPLLGTLVLAAMLLILDKMIRLFDFVINAGGPVSVVFEMLANMLPEYFSLGIPIGLLLGVLLAFRKLALSSELDALRGIGVGYTKMLKVPYMFAVALMILNIGIVGWLDPYGQYRYEGLRFDLRSGALGASIKVGEFNSFGSRMTLRIDESEQRGAKLKGIFTSVENKDGTRITATAQEGRFLGTDDPNTIIFRLQHGRLIQENPKFTMPRELVFQSYDLPVRMPNINAFRGRGDDQTELTLPEIAKRAYGETHASPQQVLAARSNLNFRLVEVVMMLMLPLLAIALAVPPKRSSSALGIFVGIVMVVTYHKINQWAQGVGAQGRVVPEIALWVPFFAFVALIIWMYHVISNHPGGQPIGALEAAFAKLAKAIRRLIPDRSKTVTEAEA